MLNQIYTNGKLVYVCMRLNYLSPFHYPPIWIWKGTCYVHFHIQVFQVRVKFVSNGFVRQSLVVWKSKNKSKTSLCIITTCNNPCMNCWIIAINSIQSQAIPQKIINQGYTNLNAKSNFLCLKVDLFMQRRCPKVE